MLTASEIIAAKVHAARFILLLGCSGCFGTALGCDTESPAAADDARAPATRASAQPGSPSSSPVVTAAAGEPTGPDIAATTIATTIYKLPNTTSRKLGYIRLGGRVRRDEIAIEGKGCKGDFYRVYPSGYVCTEGATIDMNDPLVRAASLRPALDQPMPYSYGFVRATAPQYLRVPSRAEQIKSEFKLEEHLEWYAEHRHEVQRAILGANDVPLDKDGLAGLGLNLPDGRRLSSQLGPVDLLGGGSPKGKIPFWLAEGKRAVPNVSSFKVPDYAVFADRVRRKTGLSFIDAFVSESDGMKRGFAVTVDMRLIPITKVKPDTGSPYHGVRITDSLKMPFALVSKRGSMTYALMRGRDVAKPVAAIPRRAVVPLSGNARIKDGRRFYQSLRDKKLWLQASDIGVVAPPQTMPKAAAAGEKWIDVSLIHQTLVLYQGTKPWYATLVSTGQDRLGDPKKSKATPQGEFRLRSKHIAAAMDSEENSSVSGGKKSGGPRKYSGAAAATAERLRAAEKSGSQLNEDDRRRLANIKKGRHPEYGITMRRGSQNFELRDVPWIQYFAAGYALHGAYWHDVFGTPRSHGCINLAPIDARLVFQWTDPPVPTGWHGLNATKEFVQGTLVSVRE